jgi:AcrR family transcriptional regulator
MVTSKAKRAAPSEPAMRERIVRESTRLFSERGFDGTTLQDIAAAVKVTKPAVLHHFPSKEHVLRAVLGEIVAHWEATLPRLLLAATAGESRFDTVLGAVYRFFADRGGAPALPAARARRAQRPAHALLPHRGDGRARGRARR